MGPFLSGDGACDLHRGAGGRDVVKRGWRDPEVTVELRSRRTRECDDVDLEALRENRVRHVRNDAAYGEAQTVALLRMSYEGVIGRSSGRDRRRGEIPGSLQQPAGLLSYEEHSSALLDPGDGGGKCDDAFALR
jgi:hypothetical protein